jgi:hypothetical protein
LSESTTTTTKKKKRENNENKKNNTKVIIAESAKEIYLTGYKAATKHILQKLSDSYNISGTELESLANTIGVINDAISIPNMMLVPPSPMSNETVAEEKNKESESKKQKDIDNNDNTNKTNKVIDMEDSADQHHKIIDHTQSQNNHISHQERPPSTCSSPVFYRKNSNKGEESSPPSSSVMLSCLMKDPITSQYHTAFLPLESVIPSEAYRSLPMSYLHQQSKIAAETVMHTSPRSRDSPTTSSMPHPPYLMKSPVRAGTRVSSEYTASPLMPCSPLKRRCSDDRQVPVIMNQSVVKNLSNPQNGDSISPGSLFNNGNGHFIGRRNCLPLDSKAAVAALREMSANSVPSRSEYNNHLIDIVSKEIHSKYSNLQKGDFMGHPLSLNIANRFAWE